MHRETVEVDKLDLWTSNPRVEEASDQEDALDRIYNTSNPVSPSRSRRQLMNLVASIAENGYQNDVEPILVTHDNGRYTVKDANRRLSAIKLLSDPEAYQHMLEEKDFSTLKELSSEYHDNIPTSLDVVVFDQDEEEELREVLARKHNGPLDGAGTLPWGTESKNRFFSTGRRKLADQLEGPFEQQFGESLSSYLGGSNAITSTHRVFDFSVVKKYLSINDPDHPSSEELDRVKEFSDELKAYSRAQNTILSRLRKNDVEEGVIIPLKERQNPSSISPQALIKRTMSQFANTYGRNLDRRLGARYNNQDYLDLNDINFQEIHMLLAGLSSNGELTGDSGNRWSKAYLLAPAIRVFFELSLLSVQRSQTPGINLPKPSVSKDHSDNVGYMQKLFREDNAFKQYLSQSNILFDTWNDANSVINTTDFESAVTAAQLSSHKSVKDMEIFTVVKLFNEAVLFAILCEQYLGYKKTQTLQG